LDVDFKLADDFPGDDVGYGFDNIADVISLPPILMEKYLSAAETISTLAIPAAETLPPPVKVDLSKFTKGKSNHPDGNLLAFHRSGERSTQIDLPHPGDYVLLVTAFGDQEGEANRHSF
jgi:hypothetical protein